MKNSNSNHKTYHENHKQNRNQRQHKHINRHQKQSHVSMKTNYDCCRIIPYGPKYYFFFSKKDGDPSFQIKKDKPEIKDYISIPNIIYDASLSNYDGTLCQGTILQLSNNVKMICFENIITFMGNSTKEHSWKQKYNLLLRMVSLISREQQYTYVDMYKQQQKYIFTLPVTMKRDVDIHTYLKEHTLPYKIYSIEYLNKTFNTHDRYLHTNAKDTLSPSSPITPSSPSGPSLLLCSSNSKTENPTQNQEYNKPIQSRSQVHQQSRTQKQKYKIFTIQAEEKQDIYKLYSSEYEGYAHIPSYKTSVMMNKMFRNIKENDNLDALEESDDDEEFENVSLSKHVNLDILYKFRCEWNRRFKLWEPVEHVV